MNTHSVLLSIQKIDFYFYITEMNSIINVKSYALLGAVQEEDVDAVRKLLNVGADPNFMPKSKDSLLQIAVTRNNKDLVRLLLDKGANPNVRSSECLLKIAIGEFDEDDWYTDNIEMVKLLLDKGVNPNLHYSNSLFKLAVRYHNIELIKLLLKSKAKIQFKQYDGEEGNVMDYIFYANNSRYCYDFIELIVAYNKDSEFIKKLFFKLTFSVFHDALAVKAFELVLDNGFPIDDYIISVEIDYLGTNEESEEEYESSDDEYGYNRRGRSRSHEKLMDEYAPLQLCVYLNKIGFVRINKLLLKVKILKVNMINSSHLYLEHTLPIAIVKLSKKIFIQQEYSFQL